MRNHFRTQFIIIFLISFAGMIYLSTLFGCAPIQAETMDACHKVCSRGVKYVSPSACTCVEPLVESVAVKANPLMEYPQHQTQVDRLRSSGLHDPFLVKPDDL